ncbi:MAG: cupin domain-containing protein [Rhizobiales bacterium]|nr:cupin domain-containing protein [Hyphomicrobiales bacterium]
MSSEKNINHLKYTDLPQVSRGAGIINQPIASKAIGARSLHSGITIMPGNSAVPPHTHNAEEQVTVLEGTIRIILDGKHTFICNKYDSTFISPNVQHELINDTDQEVIAMVIYGSANVNRTFAETGETVNIGSDRDKFLAR